MADVGGALLGVALVSALAGVAGGVLAASGHDRWRPVAAHVLRLSAVALVGALAVLARAFAVGDHSFVAVADHSREALGTYDRVMGLWGGMAGSLLLFTTATAVFAAIGLGRRPHPVAVAVSAGTVASLVAIGWRLADPFETLQIPALDGVGLTPILEHWAMRIHPPLVYAGMTILLVPAARTLAALADRRLGNDWWVAVRPWLLASWGLLGIGILLGAHWAYVELGWGGYWAWDPVENAALLPWLAVTVALHCRPGRHPRFAAAVTVLPLLLAVLGTTLTRSGATTSVHAFAEASSIGRALTLLLTALTVTAVALAWRAGRTIRGDRTGPLDVARLAALVTTMTVLGVVVTGTVYPVLRGWFGGDRLALEGRFFSGTAGPVVLLGAVALLGRGRLPPRWSLAASAAVAGGLLATGWRDPFPIALATVSAVAAMAGLARIRTTRRWSEVAHLGVAVLLVGVAGTATGERVTQTVAVGDAVDVGGHTVVLEALGTEPGPTPTSTAVVADVTIDGRSRRASLVAHPERGVLLAETTLRSTPLVDVQVVLRDAREGVGVLVVNVSPLQQLVWLGGLLLVAGGVAGALAQRSSPPDRRDRFESSSAPSVVSARGGAEPASVLVGASTGGSRPEPDGGRSARGRPGRRG